ncbi:hypothetical protein MLD38_016331 [Melastoma candidum]|uniref:Uncharacterized protein n=1 Tax=Melastoma candidum TaxID=119954 RepID=A0ACB9RIN4_9MYRT|nr:hypothetical protein MLD38_016331 [Melastoma candidum]
MRKKHTTWKETKRRRRRRRKGGKRGGGGDFIFDAGAELPDEDENRQIRQRTSLTHEDDREDVEVLEERDILGAHLNMMKRQQRWTS